MIRKRAMHRLGAVLAILSVLFAAMLTESFAAAGTSAKSAQARDIGRTGIVLREATINTQPRNTTVVVGETAKFTVGATGNDKLAYQWQTLAPGDTEWKNSTNASAKTAKFTITAQIGHNGYKVRCKVKDGKTRTVTTTVAVLTVKPKITAQPENQTVVVGKEASFTVAATGKATLKYQWQTLAPNTSTWKNSTNATAKKATFKITPKLDHNGFKVRCIVTDGNGNESVSSVATLMVRNNNGPSVTTLPKNTAAKVGDTAKFSVVASGKATLKYQWQTLAPGTTEWKNSTATSAKSAELVITAQVAHGGYQFRCVVTDGDGKRAISCAATLTVKPAILAQSDNVRALVGAPAKFMVCADGKGTLKYQWQTKAPGATEWKDSTNATAKSPIFVLTAQNGHDGYRFRCVVTDANGQSSSSAAATLKISDGKLNEKNFPDDIFREFVKWYDKDGSNVLTWSELEGMHSIDVDSYGIADLTGIEYFADLESLNCAQNKLTSLDVSQNLSLRELWCGQNRLKTLDVSTLTSLRELVCYNNDLTGLNTSCNPNLNHLLCGQNRLKALDVTKNRELVQLFCAYNKLTKLNLTKNVKLLYLECDDNSLTSLDVSKNIRLQTFSCSFNNLTTLDVSNLAELERFNCGNNRLTRLDVRNNEALVQLDCYSNSLTSLNVAKNTELEELWCGDNQLSSLNLANNTKLLRLLASSNDLTKLDISKNKELEYCEVSYGVQVTTGSGNNPGIVHYM